MTGSCECIRMCDDDQHVANYHYGLVLRNVLDLFKVEFLVLKG